MTAAGGIGMRRIGLLLPGLKRIRDAHLILAIGIAPTGMLLLYVTGALIAP